MHCKLLFPLFISRYLQRNVGGRLSKDQAGQAQGCLSLTLNICEPGLGLARAYRGPALPRPSPSSPETGPRLEPEEKKINLFPHFHWAPRKIVVDRNSLYDNLI
eukprot:TRINITY_DN9303_c0_g1_i6.p2 TRINITY_DN9303_c0_g1~~TRINITY_DN9303_c0_g1_i6.p2  ORF type:complete len:104 (-),score=8.00 TRINITY_DN9303_c0_g1_i6:172-483(-)